MEISKQAQSKADTHSENAAKRTISVHATGEASCPPDVLQFIVSVSASKDTVEAAQASVRRRTDYILQVLRNNGIKERCIHCSSEISRGESVSMQTDVMVRADSLAKCETVRNLLVEKLDPSVRFTPISFHHTPETKDNKRYCTIPLLKLPIGLILVLYTQCLCLCMSLHYIIVCYGTILRGQLMFVAMFNTLFPRNYMGQFVAILVIFPRKLHVSGAICSNIGNCFLGIYMGQFVGCLLILPVLYCMPCVALMLVSNYPRVGVEILV